MVVGKMLYVTIDRSIFERLGDIADGSYLLKTSNMVLKCTNFDR
jgi:hypothetical protein